jgi:hypothetical protein
MHRIARLPAVAAFLFATGAAVAGLAGCAAPSDDAPAAATSTQHLTAYDEVVANGTKIESDTTITPQQSAKTHLIGYLKDRQPGVVQKQLLAIAKWTEIEDADGDQPFTQARVSSDHTADGVRTIAAKVKVSAGVEIQLGCTAKVTDDDTRVIEITNTAPARHWLAGTLLETGKLTIAIKLVPYEEGTIVDATIKVKLAKMEDRARDLAGVLGPVFDWLDESTPSSPAPSSSSP